MKTLLFLLLLIPGLCWGLTFKDGKQVHDDKVSSSEIENYVPNALAGYQIENRYLNLSYPPHEPSVVEDKYWFGWFWAAHDFNNDGYMDYLYTGTMNPNNVEITGEDTGGICGGERCKGEMPGPTLFLGTKDGNFILKSDLFIDNRELPGQSLSRQNLVADYNNDGVLDLFIADHGVGTHQGIRDSYFLSQQDGTWVESSKTHLSKPNYTIFDHGGAVGDIDNDGDMDIVLTELKNQITCWINDGFGKMKFRVCGNVNAFGIELGDMDGDGYLDLVHAGHEGGAAKGGSTNTGIVLNDGKGNFHKRVELPMIPKWTTVSEVALWDLDKDGDLDITLSRAGHLYVGVAVQIIENLGLNKFDTKLYTLLEAPPDYVPTHEGNEWNNFVQNFLFGDFDNDGQEDILLVAHRDGKHKHIGASILKNEGDVKFRHIPHGEKENPIILLADYKFLINENIKNFAKEIKPVSVEKLEGYTYSKERIYFDSLGAYLIGAKLLKREKNFYIYDGLFEKGEDKFFITLCSEYYKKFKFIGNRVGFAYGNGFNKNPDLEKYGKSECGNEDGFLGHWEDDAQLLKDETNISPFLFEIEHKWKKTLDNLLIMTLEDKNYYLNNWLR